MNSNERIYYSHDTASRAMRARAIVTIVFMTLGIGIGAAIALLFAPSSGKETREEIMENVEDGLDAGQDKLEPTMKKLGKQFSGFRKSVEKRMKS
jgi:gas vesicle protein